MSKEEDVAAGARSKYIVFGDCVKSFVLFRGPHNRPIVQNVCYNGVYEENCAICVR